MIDIKNYIEKKEKELVSIAKLGSGFTLSQKKFDPDTGEKITPVTAGFHINDIETLKTALQKTIADLDALITDAKAL